jgi:hypothetical protein
MHEKSEKLITIIKIKILPDCEKVNHAYFKAYFKEVKNSYHNRLE